MQHRDARAGLEIPHPDGSILGGGHQAIHTRHDGHAVHGPGVADEDAHDLPRGQVPHPHRAIGRSGDGARAVGRQRQRLDGARVSLENAR